MGAFKFAASSLALSKLVSKPNSDPNDSEIDLNTQRIAKALKELTTDTQFQDLAQLIKRRPSFQTKRRLQYLDKSFHPTLAKASDIEDIISDIEDTNRRKKAVPELEKRLNHVFETNFLGADIFFDMDADNKYCSREKYETLKEILETKYEIYTGTLEINSYVYIVEDCATSYWSDYEGGFRKETTMIEYFKRLVDDINFRGIYNYGKPVPLGRREDWCIETISREQPDCRTDIESITFLNGIILIRKR